jgi:hypothetical protein
VDRPRSTTPHQHPHQAHQRPTPTRLPQPTSPTAKRRMSIRHDPDRAPAQSAQPLLRRRPIAPAEHPHPPRTCQMITAPPRKQAPIEIRWVAV